MEFQTGWVLYFFLNFLQEVTSLSATVDYIYSSNPCRPKDQLCSVRCTLFKMKGDFDCEFCLCKDSDFYVQWETTPLSTHTAHIISTLPSDVVLVNNIKYHKVSDPCSVSRDRMCPWACAEVKSIDSHGHSCTMCDCKGTSVLIG